MTQTQYDFIGKTKPDFGRLERAIRMIPAGDAIPFFEPFSNIHIPVLEHLGEKVNDLRGLSGAEGFLADWENRIRYATVLGYDYVDVWEWHIGFVFQGPQQAAAETKEGNRYYITSDAFAISNRAEFDAFPWPGPDWVDSSRLDSIARLMPSGMKVIFCTRGILETTMDLLGHEKICYLLYDDPDLVRDVFTRVGEAYLGLHRLAAKHPAVGAITYCDDLGFKTQTLLSPETYRELLFPWHRRIAENAHENSKLAILHACGNLREIMEDILDCGWDAKQSFEDIIEPIWEARKKYGSRLALLGGFDVDKLSRMTAEEVRAHTRFLKKEMASGGWALGTGNSVANYIPVENFLTVLDEGRK